VLIAAFGASDQAIVDGLFGRQPMGGRLHSTSPPARPTQRRVAPMSPSTPSRLFSKKVSACYLTSEVSDQGFRRCRLACRSA
jgi:hypothetical protein